MVKKKKLEILEEDDFVCEEDKKDIGQEILKHIIKGIKILFEEKDIINGIFRGDLMIKLWFKMVKKNR